jgi:hypothetical protein
MAARRANIEYDVFLSYSHHDAEWVEDLAMRLSDAHRVRPWCQGRLRIDTAERRWATHTKNAEP